MFITKYKYQLLPEHMEHDDSESLTQPDMAMPLREMVMRYQNGTLGDIAKMGYYDDEADMDNILTSPLQDLTDLDDAKEEIQKIHKAKKAMDEAAKKQLEQDKAVEPTQHKEAEKAT